MRPFAGTRAVLLVAIALSAAIFGPQDALGQIKSPDDLKKGPPPGFADRFPTEKLLGLKRNLTRDEALSVLKGVVQQRTGGTPISLPTALETPITLDAITPARAGRAYLSGSAVSWNVVPGHIVLPGAGSSVVLNVKPERQWQPILINVEMSSGNEGTSVSIVSAGPGIPRAEQRYTADGDFRTFNYAFLGGTPDWHQIAISANGPLDIQYVSVTSAR